MWIPRVSRFRGFTEFTGVTFIIIYSMGLHILSVYTFFLQGTLCCFEPEVPFFFDSVSLTVPYKFLIFQFTI